MVTALGVLILILALAAAVSLARDKDLAPGVKLLCLLGILAFPVLGPAVWFFHQFRLRRSSAAGQARSTPPSSVQRR
ncbi:MAG: PLDc N-terminal domain-containing protein [Arthrobacter sp.]